MTIERNFNDRSLAFWKNLINQTIEISLLSSRIVSTNGPIKKGSKVKKKKIYYFKDFARKFETDINANFEPNRGEGSFSGGAGLVITSEHLFLRLTTQEELTALREFLTIYFEKVKIVCYFRPQEERAVSLHSTGLKMAATSELDHRLRGVNEGQYHNNYYEVAKLWSEVFGKDNMELRIFNRHQLKNQDIRFDFVDPLQSVGMLLDPSKLKYNQQQLNESLPSLLGGAFRAVNELVPYWNSPPMKGINQYNLRIKEALRKIELLHQGRFKSNTPGEVQARFGESNKKFFEEFLPGRSFQDIQVELGAPSSISVQDGERIVYEITKQLLAREFEA